MTARTKKKAGPPRAAHSATQERSRDTLERILGAAEELLETREFDELTMVDLAKRARCGVGTVYGRLPNKESLLVCLHDRCVQSGVASSAIVFGQCRDAPLEVRVEKVCGLVVDFFSANRGVTRAVTNHLFARRSVEESDRVAAFRDQATAAFKQAAGFLAEAVDRSVHSRPQAACEFALLAATDVAQGRVVFGDRSTLPIHYSSKALKARIAAVVLAYLQHG